MALDFFRRRRILKNTNTLDLIPVCMKEYREEDDGTLTLIVPKFRNEKFGKWFMPKKKSLWFSIHLDELGSAVWLEIDGKRSVAEIIGRLKEKFGEKISPASERVTTFVTQLYAQRYISFTQLLNS